MEKNGREEGGCARRMALHKIGYRKNEIASKISENLKHSEATVLSCKTCEEEALKKGKRVDIVRNTEHKSQKADYQV